MKKKEKELKQGIPRQSSGTDHSHLMIVSGDVSVPKTTLWD